MFGAACIAAIKAHAVADYPRESVGMVVDGAYQPLSNEASEPDAVAFDERVALRHGSALQAIVHSHPDGPAYPSYRDQASQIAWDVPFGIVTCGEAAAGEPLWWGSGAPRRPYLEATGFRWVIQDCYAKIRDVYEQARGIRLKEFAREWGAWKAAPDRPAFSGYLEHYRDAGFVQVDQPRDWDLAVMRFGEYGVPSHAGVLLPGNMLLHHLGHDSDPVDLSRLSKREPLGRWMRCIKNGGFWLRYAGGQ